MNFAIAAMELVAAVRGERSQNLLSRRLGFRGNQLRRWETGERRIPWQDFVRLCRLCDVNIDEAISRILIITDDPMDGCAVARRLLGGSAQTKVSQVTGISRYAIVRWVNRKSAPALEDILALIHWCQFVLFEFLAYLVDVESIPSLVEEYQIRNRRKKVFYRHPLAPAVLSCLKLDDYRKLPNHQEGFIARVLGISIDEEKTILEELKAVGKITLVGGHYLVSDERMELTESFEIRTFCTYWLERAARIVGDEKNSFPILSGGIDVYAIDYGTVAKLRDEYLVFFQKVRTMLSQCDGPREAICLFNSQLIDMTCSTGPGLRPANPKWSAKEHSDQVYPPKDRRSSTGSQPGHDGVEQHYR